MANQENACREDRHGPAEYFSFFMHMILRELVNEPKVVNEIHRGLEVPLFVALIRRTIVLDGLDRVFGWDSDYSEGQLVVRCTARQQPVAPREIHGFLLFC
jgi:hypothetical protein